MISDCACLREAAPAKVGISEFGISIQDPISEIDWKLRDFG